VVRRGETWCFKLSIYIRDGDFEDTKVDQIPVVKRTEIVTEAELNEGESLLVGGIALENESTKTEGVPGLSKMPVVGGLFLAFPGIFPAGITLIERHEKKKKRDKGLRGERRGRSVSAVVAAGAVAGSIGLVAFGALAWCALPRLAEWQALLAAMIAWLAVSLLAWFIRFRL